MATEKNIKDGHRILSETEALQILKIHNLKLRSMMRRHEIYYKEINNMYYFIESDIIKLSNEKFLILESKMNND
jgi:hypothetical protein